MMIFSDEFDVELCQVPLRPYRTDFSLMKEGFKFFVVSERQSVTTNVKFCHVYRQEQSFCKACSCIRSTSFRDLGGKTNLETN